MRPIEERLWEYIDGTSPAEEKNAIEQLLRADPVIRQLHEEFLSLSNDVRSIELDEPALRFTQNVMDRVALEPAPKALRTKVDLRIIKGIGGFFMVTIAVLIAYSFSQISWGTGGFESTLTIPKIDLPQVSLSSNFSPAFLQASILAFIIMGLFVIDKYFHYRKHMHQLTHPS